MDRHKIHKAIHTPSGRRVMSSNLLVSIQLLEDGVNLSNKVVAEAHFWLVSNNVGTRKVDAIGGLEVRVDTPSGGKPNSVTRPLSRMVKIDLMQVSNPAHLNNTSSRLNRFPELRSFKELMKESIAPTKNFLRCPTLTTGNLHKFVITNLERWVKRLRKMPATSNKIVRELLLSGQNRAMTSIKSIAEDNYVVPQA